MTGIYKITERETGTCYIGQSKNIERRWKTHHKRFPPALFTYEVLREVSIPQFMNSFEKFYIKLYDSHANGFNGTIGGTNVKSTHPSDETLAKISQKLRGRIHSEEAKAKMSEAQKGKTYSEETRAKMSASAKVKIFTDEHRSAIGASQLGRTRSDKTCELISASKRGKPRDEATRLRISETLRNKRNAQN